MNALKSIFSWLGRFLEKARTVMLNLGTAFVLIFFTIIIIGAFTSSGPEVKDPSGRVLFIDPVGTVVDQEVFNSDFLSQLGADSSMDQIQTRDLIQLIRAAAEDEEIPAVFIDFSATGFAGPTTAINIAKELKALRESGKRVIAMNDRLSTTSYLMASQASEVWVHPVGSISVRGLGGMRNYNKDLFDNLKITIHNYSQGDFKSATEASWRSSMSDNDRMQREALLFPIWDEMKSLMAEGRGIESADIQSFADDHVGFFGEAAIGNIAYAKANNIIDGSKSFPEFRQYMIEEFGLDEEAETETYKTFLPLLTEHKSLTMISKPTMRTEAQVTTFHTYYGSSLLMHKKSLIAFAGLRVCLPVELEPADISKFSVNSNVPNLDSLLNVNNLSDLDAVQPDPNIMEKVRNVAILPPKIATELLTMTDISPVQVLLRVLKTIKKFETDLIHEISLPDPDYGEEEKSDLSTEEEIFLTVREDSKLEYGEMLISLWKLAYNSPRVEPIRCLPISDNRRQVFLQHLCHANHSDVNMTPLPPLPPTPAPDLTKWATSMSKVAQA